MARFNRAGAVAAPLALVVLAIDLLMRHSDPPLAAAAGLDETAHTITAILLLSALVPRADPALKLGTLLGGVLIDVDHVPLLLGNELVTAGATRPYSHSLAMVGGLLLVAAGLARDRRRIVLGAAFGLATHLLRDMATGGVPLFWPLTRATIALPYTLYATLLLAAASLVLWRSVQQRGAVAPEVVPTDDER